MIVVVMCVKLSGPVKKGRCSGKGGAGDVGVWVRRGR